MWTSASYEEGRWGWHAMDACMHAYTQCTCSGVAGCGMLVLVWCDEILRCVVRCIDASWWFCVACMYLCMDMRIGR